MTPEIANALGVLGAGIAIVVGLTVIAMLIQRYGDRFSKQVERLVAKGQRVVVLAKREHIGRNDMGFPCTEYYVTFQYPDGNRVELEVEGRDYGLLMAGDKGELLLENDKFARFDRK